MATFQGYWTPPEEDSGELERSVSVGAVPLGPTPQDPTTFDIPKLPALSKHLLDNAPPGLRVRNLRPSTDLNDLNVPPGPRYAWTEDDSGPIPSDIEVVRGSGNIAHSQSTGDFPDHAQRMFSQNPAGLAAGDPVFGENPYLQRYPLSDYRPIAGQNQLSLRPGGRYPPSVGQGGYVGPPSLHHSISQPSEHLLHPGAANGGSSAVSSDHGSHRTSSPQQRSPQSQRRGPPSHAGAAQFHPGIWINPIGTVYQPATSEDEWKWALQSQAATESNSGLKPEDEALKRPTPWLGGMENDGYYNPQLYSNPPPYHPSLDPYLTPGGPDVQQYGFQRRDRSGYPRGQQRPYSADAHRLFAVHEDQSASGFVPGTASSGYKAAAETSGFKKGRRSSYIFFDQFLSSSRDLMMAIHAIINGQKVARQRAR